MQATIEKTQQTQLVHTYTLPSDVNFEDVLATFEAHHERLAGDGLFLVDDKIEARLVARSLSELDLLLYDPHTLKTTPIATFQLYQGNDSQCEDWEELSFCIAWLALIEKTKTFERLMGIALIQVQGQWVIW
ncbi:MAG: hypothetical protein SXA11_06630 [Cyanobacteriota bacterium]|nr:hypothetical protein [Cyanobacteriota bacterium]